MSLDQGDALDRALADLEACLAAKKAPTRHHARAVLVPLGERLRTGGSGGAGPWLERLKEIANRAPDAWSRAVEDELLMACTEHVRSVDPRWIRHPSYDFEYTKRAREQLGARLDALRELGFEVDRALLDRVDQADALMASRLSRGSERKQPITRDDALHQEDG